MAHLKFNTIRAGGRCSLDQQLSNIEAAVVIDPGLGNDERRGVGTYDVAAEAQLCHSWPCDRPYLAVAIQQRNEGDFFAEERGNIRTRSIDCGCRHPTIKNCGDRKSRLI